MTNSNDPFRGREPTSHELMSGQAWDASYHDGPAPWDIGRPQPAIVRQAVKTGFVGHVLDAGCGTGENALYLASLGLAVLGVDVAESAVASARRKAAERRIEAEFETADALQLHRLGRTFETVVDCSLFHTFDRNERTQYVVGLARVTKPQGTVVLLCFSDEGDNVGPHPVSYKELNAAFSDGIVWNIETIEPERLQTRIHGEDGAPAWIITVRRQALVEPAAAHAPYAPS